MASRTTRMHLSAGGVLQQEQARIVKGNKGYRPQPVGKTLGGRDSNEGTGICEKRFWLFTGGVILLWTLLRVFDFTILPPTYKGLVITQPFYGLHSWDVANRAWAARSHLKYGLGYTKGLRTLVVGDPPPWDLWDLWGHHTNFTGRG